MRKSDVSWSFAADVLQVSGAVSVVAFAGSRALSACVNISLRRTRYGLWRFLWSRCKDSS